MIEKKLNEPIVKPSINGNAKITKDKEKPVEKNI